jgi:hypothetical protein
VSGRGQQRDDELRELVAALRQALEALEGGDWRIPRLTRC